MFLQNFRIPIVLLLLLIVVSACIQPATNKKAGSEEIPPAGSDASEEEDLEAGSLSAITFATLTAGTGFSGPTAEPSKIGSPSAAGYDAQAIARWDVVPGQTITSTLHIGALAFHRNGIDRVEFSLNNGPWVSVTEPQMNPDTEVREYTVTLDPTQYTDGLLEIRAIAFPTVGRPRVLESLHLYSNASASLPSEFRYVSTSGNDSNDGLSPATAKQSIMKAIYSITNRDGARIFLAAGSYTLETASWPQSQMTNTNRWITVEPAPGVTRDQVNLVAAASDTRWGSLKRVRFKNVTISQANGLILSSWVADSRIWYDECIVNGRSDRQGEGFAGSAWPGGRYFTDSSFWGLDNGPQGLIIRNSTVTHYLSDAFSSSYLILNSSADDQDGMGTGAHPDIVQWYGHYENVIVQGLTSSNAPDSQGLFQGGDPSVQTLKDIAVIDCDLDHGTTIARVFLFLSTSNHFIVKDSNFVGPTQVGGSISDFVISGTTFSDAPLNPGILFQ